MAFPPRPRSSRAEPSFAPVGAAPRDAAPIRAAAPRPAVAKPAGAGDLEPLRFPGDHRRAGEAQSLSLSADDRLVMSSNAPAATEKRQGGFFRLFGFSILLALAAFGAYAIYLRVDAFLR